MPEENSLSYYINKSKEISEMFDRNIRIGILSSFTNWNEIQISVNENYIQKVFVH
mgnify:CR=1 FL=1